MLRTAEAPFGLSLQRNAFDLMGEALMGCFGKACRIAVVVAVVLFAGCASKITEPAAKAVVDHITVIPVDSPGTTYSENRSLAAGLLLPGWIQWLDNKWKAEQFAAQMKKTMLELGPSMTAALVAQLEQQGYRVTVLDRVPRYPDHPDEVDYAKIETSGPVLHVWFVDVSMYSGAASRHYLPRVNVSAYLTIPKAEDSLYYETIYYGADSRGEQTYWSIPPHENYKYETFDAMMSRPDHVSEGFHVGLQAVARHLAQEFARQFDRSSTR